MRADLLRFLSRKIGYGENLGNITKISLLSSILVQLLLFNNQNMGNEAVKRLVPIQIQSELIVKLQWKKKHVFIDKN